MCTQYLAFNRFLIALFLAAIVALSPVPNSLGQNATGEPESPAATATINPLRIPNLPAKFDGVINLDARDSKPYWQPQVLPPRGRRTFCW
jgi:arylsulfatase